MPATSTQIAVIAPSSAVPLTGSVRVTCLSNGLTQTAADGFSFRPPPFVATVIAPSPVYQSGGQLITIYGNFSTGNDIESVLLSTANVAPVSVPSWTYGQPPAGEPFGNGLTFPLPPLPESGTFQIVVSSASMGECVAPTSLVIPLSPIVLNMTPTAAPRTLGGAPYGEIFAMNVYGLSHIRFQLYNFASSTYSDIGYLTRRVPVSFPIPVGLWPGEAGPVEMLLFSLQNGYAMTPSVFLLVDPGIILNVMYVICFSASFHVSDIATARTRALSMVEQRSLFAVFRCALM